MINFNTLFNHIYYRFAHAETIEDFKEVRCPIGEDFSPSNIQLIIFGFKSSLAKISYRFCIEVMSLELHVM